MNTIELMVGVRKIPEVSDQGDLFRTSLILPGVIYFNFDA